MTAGSLGRALWDTATSPVPSSLASTDGLRRAERVGGLPSQAAVTTVRRVTYPRLTGHKKAALPLGKAADRAGFIALTALGLILGLAFAAGRLRAIDSLMIWNTGHAAHYYDAVWSCLGDACSYVYPPPLAQVAGLLPWSVFIVGWTGLLFLGWWAATRGWSLPTFVGSVLVVAAIGYGNALTYGLNVTAGGNPQILVAAVCVIGFRYPAAWSFVLLTKVAPGVGIVWFAVRREWRNLALALGATVLIAVVSFVLAPGAWADYLRFTIANFGTPSPVPVVPIPFIVRFPMSLALIVWGALTNRRWTVPVGAGWASLALYEWSFVTVWMAALGLRADEVHRKRGRRDASGEGVESPTRALVAL